MGAAIGAERQGGVDGGSRQQGVGGAPAAGDQEERAAITVVTSGSGEPLDTDLGYFKHWGNLSLKSHSVRCFE